MRGIRLLGSNSSCCRHLQITVTVVMAICKHTNFNIWVVTLVPFSTWNAFSTSKGFMEATWWWITNHRAFLLFPLLCLSWVYRWKGFNLSFLLIGPIPFSEIAFQIGHTSPSPAMLDTCLFLKIIRVLFKTDPFVGHIVVAWSWHVLEGSGFFLGRKKKCHTSEK